MALLQHIGQTCIGCRRELGCVDVCGAHAEELFARVPEAVAGCAVCLDEAAVGTVDEDRVAGAVEERPVLALALLQLLFSPLALDDRTKQGCVDGYELLCHIIGLGATDDCVVVERPERSVGRPQRGHRIPAMGRVGESSPVPLGTGVRLVDCARPHGRRSGQPIGPELRRRTYERSLIGGTPLHVCPEGPADHVAVTEEDGAALDPEPLTGRLDSHAAHAVHILTGNQVIGDVEDGAETDGQALLLRGFASLVGDAPNPPVDERRSPIVG